MIGVYFSGTGNTKHCVTRLVRGLDSHAAVLALKDSETPAAIQKSDTIIFGYPVYFSNLPKIVRNFINDNATIFNNKKIIIVATMGLFSGDGAGCSARLFKEYGSTVLGALHIKMPDCIGDSKLLKKTTGENLKIISDADKKIDNTIKNIQNNCYPKEGLNFFYHLAGLFGQRLYFPNKTKNWYDGIKVCKEKCTKCGLCARLCPMENISILDNEIKVDGKCTMCYSCFSNCPNKAITVLGKEVFEQYKFENYTEQK